MTKSLGPLMEVARIQSEINRLFDNLLDLGGGEEGAGTWIPNADILETESELVVKIELPGVPADGLSLSVTRGNLTIQGEKPRHRAPEGSATHAIERSFGPFRRVIQLGVPVNTRQATALLKNGLLRISFPKVPNRRGEEVPIEVQSA